MVKRKFTVFLMPLDEGGYQVFFPYYPNCVTDGLTTEEAIKNAKDAMEGILQAEAKHGGDPVPDYVYAPHVAVGEVDIEVPDSLIEAAEKKARTTG
jgi:predicted RNase H-like HicB family nuclease